MTMINSLQRDQIPWIAMLLMAFMPAGSLQAPLEPHSSEASMDTFKAPVQPGSASPFQIIGSDCTCLLLSILAFFHPMHKSKILKLQALNTTLASWLYSKKIGITCPVEPATSQKSCGSFIKCQRALCRNNAAFICNVCTPL